jgi:hypothetical protein
MHSATISLAGIGNGIDEGQAAAARGAGRLIFVHRLVIITEDDETAARSPKNPGK